MFVRYTASITDAIGCATRAGSIIKTGPGAISQNRAELAACIHTIEDFGFKQFFGDFPPTFSACEYGLVEQEALSDALHSLSSSAYSIADQNPPMASFSAGRIRDWNWKHIMEVVLPIILKLVMEENQ